MVADDRADSQGAEEAEGQAVKRGQVRPLLMVGRGIRFPGWMLDAILERWLERADGRGAPALRLDGEPLVDHQGYTEPSELLWICTVGCKLARCPSQPTDPQNPSSTRMPVVEQVVRLNAAVAERNNKLEHLRSDIKRLSPPPGKKAPESTAGILAELREDEALMDAELRWAAGRLAQLAGSRDYRDGRTYLTQAFTEAILDDPTFLVWSVYACWLVSPQLLLRPMIERAGITVKQLAERLNISYETVRCWFADRASQRYVQIPIRYAPVLRELLFGPRGDDHADHRL